VRQLVKTLMFRTGTVRGVLRYEPGNMLHRSFNFGILGQQEEVFDVKNDMGKVRFCMQTRTGHVQP
jgi:hypothetical protein